MAGHSGVQAPHLLQPISQHEAHQGRGEGQGRWGKEEGLGEERIVEEGGEERKGKGRRRKAKGRRGREEGWGRGAN
jgi:hypothetical protein